MLLSNQDILLGGNRLTGQLPQTLSNPDLERLDLRCSHCSASAAMQRRASCRTSASAAALLPGLWS